MGCVRVKFELDAYWTCNKKYVNLSYTAPYPLFSVHKSDLSVYFNLALHSTLCSGLFWSDITESSVTMNMNEEVNTELHFVLTWA